MDEVLRWDGPMEIAAWRYTREAVEIGGVLIPAGQPVIIACGAADRDAHRFDDPDRMDITRTDNPHLGFGHGVHHCLGAPLARIEAAIALNTLVSRLHGMALAVPPEQLERQPSHWVRGLHKLPVTFTALSSPGGPG